MKLKEINIIRIILVIIIFIQGCSSNLELLSKWKDQSITIDGNDSDWINKTIYVKEEKFLIGIQNDNEFLYLALITSDIENQARIIGRGLTVWFDREGGTDKIFGVKFPLGLVESESLPVRQNIEENPFTLNKLFEKEQSELEVIVPVNEEITRMNILQASGIDAKISHLDDRMIYEMRIALQPDNNNLYGIGIKDKNSKIGVGFETSEIDRVELKQKMISDNFGGEDKEKIKDKMGGRIGGGMRGDKMGGSMHDPIKYWINVQLKVDN